MIHLRTRTSYSFRKAFAPLERVVEKAEIAMAITDTGTWGHVQFYTECIKQGIKPILAVSINVVVNAKEREKQGYVSMVVLPRNAKGLKEVYDISTLAESDKRFYYVPRIDYSDLHDFTDNVFVLTGVNPLHSEIPNRDNFLREANVSAPWYAQDGAVATGDNWFVDKNDDFASRAVHDYIESFNTPQWIISDEEYLEYINNKNALSLARQVASDCHDGLPMGSLIHVGEGLCLRDLCLTSASKRGISLPPEYMSRLDRELEVIEQKNFADYFFLVHEMIAWAKKRMIVGPARGSAAGSLVSYCLGITEVDPIKHNLIFERFIDVNREDYPDIDIDFPPESRAEVEQHLRDKYGQHRVAKLGTVGSWNAPVLLNEVSKSLGIEYTKILDYKAQIGDGDTHKDLLSTTRAGEELLRDYPDFGILVDIEGTPKQAGVHPAGVVVSDGDITESGTVNREGVLQLDKNDAETIGLIKLDLLGLRTLTTITSCLELVGKDLNYLLEHDENDPEVFKLFNDGRLCGIFQFEGGSVRKATSEMGVDCFNDLVHLTTLVRPGPNAMQHEFIERRHGKRPVVPLHDSLTHITEETYGILLYQEQLMEVCREAGFSWPEVSEVRRLMSKSKGFEKYANKFIEGLMNNQGISPEECQAIWNRLVTFGQYAFNKSHAVAYSMITYWCAILKTYHPQEFFVSCLRNPKDDEETLIMLREMDKEGIKVKPVDTKNPSLNWEIANGKIVGGLVNIKGVAEKKALDILKRLEEGSKLTPTQIKNLENPITPFDSLYPCREQFKAIYDNPKGHGLFCDQIYTVDRVVNPYVYCIIGKVTDVKHRKNGYGQEYCSLYVEDDTGSLPVTFSAKPFRNLDNKPEKDKFYVIKGQYNNDYGRLFGSNCRILEVANDKV
jgi:DNA polymerase III alpha subunit